ncbi:MAG: hypothetical protein Q9199_007128 [Rusavskia elegans]
MGRMVYNFTSKARLFGIKAWRFTLYFVVLDIVAFIVQAGGASSASGQGESEHDILLGEQYQQPPNLAIIVLLIIPEGLHIYMGGVGFQQIFVLVFFYIAFRFQQQVRQENPDRLYQALLLLYVEYAALILITVRIVFRLIEYSKGLDSTIPNHEVYQYVFDTLPMLVCLVIFNVIHPGRIMPGKESDFPSRKERKAYFKTNNSPNSLKLLPTHASMPENAFQPTPQVVPNHGYVQ